jgi:hypothetical protein
MPMVKFEPTDQQREDVAALSSAGTLTLAAIAKTIVNPRTNRAVSVKTLNRIFKQELAENTQLQAQALKNLREFLEKKDWQATKYVCDHIVGLREREATASKAVQNEIRGLNAELVGIKVEIPFTGQWVERPDGSRAWEGGPGPEPKLIEHQPSPPPLSPPKVNEPKPGETIRARTITEPAGLLPDWRQEDTQLREAARPAEPTIPEPMRLSDLQRPTLKAKRLAKEERARAEGWTSDSNPRGSAFPNPSNGKGKGWMR